MDGTRGLRVLLLLIAIFAVAAPAGASAASYEVGIGSRNISPNNADGSWDDPATAEVEHSPVYLGGFGIGGPGIFGDGRAADGILGSGPSVRAIAFSDGAGHTAAIADIEAQGWFIASESGPYGLNDIRKAVAEATNGTVPAESVIVQSDHSHGGLDQMGVWGGIPDSYKAFIKQQTVDAIVEAYETRQAGSLFYGETDAMDLLHNQYDGDPLNAAMDSAVKVLQARDADGRPFATMLNFGAHSDVLGSGNHKITGDWPQAANPLLEKRFGGKAMTMVGTLGRTQPNRGDCTPDELAASGQEAGLCALDKYATLVVDKAAIALSNATEITGDPVVAARSYLLRDVGTNPALLAMFFFGKTQFLGQDPNIPLDRARKEPWMGTVDAPTGRQNTSVLGTSASSVRIGDVLISAGPGEMYPQIPLKVKELFTGLRGYMTAGLANDQLGYIIAPFEAYPRPVTNPTNDNYLFNVSHTLGERLTCVLLRGAHEVFARHTAPIGDTSATDTIADYPRCAAFTEDLQREHGADAAP
jgi:hypothetical protein